VTFGAPASLNAQLLVVGSIKNTQTTYTAPGGFTELQDVASTAAPNGQSLESSYRTSAASGSPSITMSQNANWRTIGIEIAHA